MNSDVRANVLKLLRSSRKREQKIKLLQYELLHHASISGDEAIADMTFNKTKEDACCPIHFSDKTLYISLNYQELAEKVNTEAVREVVAELAELEDVQNRLRYYVSLLADRQALVIRRAYFDGCAWDQIADEMGIVRRTAHKIKNQALDNLACMYEYVDAIRE